MKCSKCLDTSIAIMNYTGVMYPDDLKYPLFYKFYGFAAQTIFFVLIVVAEISHMFLVRKFLKKAANGLVCLSSTGAAERGLSAFLANSKRRRNAVFRLDVFGDTALTVEAALLLLSHIVQGVKVVNIWYKQDRIKQLIQFIDGPKFNNYDPTKRPIIENTIHWATFAGNAILASAGITAIFWSIVPVLKTELALPLLTAYPFDITGSVMFTIMYAYSSLSVTIVAVEDAAANYLVSGLMILAGAHLDVLSAELDDIGMLNVTDKKNLGYEQTKICIQYHQNIIEFVKELGNIFGFAIFCQFIASSVIVCMTLFKITITSEPMEMMTMVFYLICVFLELLMYCYPGDLIINKSLLVAESACPSKWSGELRRRRALLLCTMRAQRALVINAGGLFTVSLPTAAAVVRSAYSYYAVLQQKAGD